MKSSSGGQERKPQADAVPRSESQGAVSASGPKEARRCRRGNEMLSSATCHPCAVRGWRGWILIRSDSVFGDAHALSSLLPSRGGMSCLRGSRAVRTLHRAERLLVLSKAPEKWRGHQCLPRSLPVPAKRHPRLSSLRLVESVWVWVPLHGRLPRRNAMRRD